MKLFRDTNSIQVKNKKDKNIKETELSFRCA